MKNKKEVERKFQKSLDYRWLEKQRSVYIGFWFLFLILMLIGHMIQSALISDPSLYLSIMMFVLAIFYHIKGMIFLKNCERYEIQEAVLDNAHISFFRIIYYKVKVKISESETKILKTRAMWTSLEINSFCNFRTQAYSGKKVYIAYDRKKNKVYVLGLKTEIDEKENTL